MFLDRTQLDTHTCAPKHAGTWQDSYEGGTVCSETLAHKIQKPVNQPKNGYSIKNTGKVWNQEKLFLFQL